MLKSFRELQQFRARTTDGFQIGRLRDIYFDDLTWKIKHLVLSVEPVASGRQELLLNPAQIAAFAEECGLIELNIAVAKSHDLPLASAAPPVCKQYAAFSVSQLASKANRPETDPHLRSAKAVLQYQVEMAGVAEGVLADFLFEPCNWEIRYLAVQQSFERKTMRFHLLPQSVERITWSTQRVVLRQLEPVAVDLGDIPQAGNSGLAA